MEYGKVIPGRFLRRPNRFTAAVEVNGAEETVHVKNTGRCRELLIPGCEVFLSVPERKENRRTGFDLIAVKKLVPGGELLINMDSQAPNRAVEEWLPRSGLFAPGAVITRECTHGGSRFDFRIAEGEKISFLEVKGVTLENDGIAMFPDAPTERGVKHVKELTECVSQGYGAYVLFVIQMKGIDILRPNDETHKAFGDALRLASKAGVKILAMDCIVTESSMIIDQPVPVELSG